MEIEIKPKDPLNKLGNLAFVKEVAKYFMDFLETDFHKRKNPKRSIKYRNNENLLVGVNAGKYSSFVREVWKLINHAFDKKYLSSISKGVHRTSLPKNLLDLIDLQVGKIKNADIKNLIDNISGSLEGVAVLHKKQYDQAISLAMDKVSVLLRQELVLPFINSIQKSIESLGIGDENDVFLMEEELTDIFTRQIENKIAAILKSLITDSKINVSKELKTVIDIKDVRDSILAFFQEFKVGDLFGELFEMERNRTILDKQDFYLYFCDITFSKVKYPIFYIPLSIKRDKDTFNIEFDAQVYINKKALTYIVQEYNKENGKQGNLKEVTERIIYLSQQDNNFHELMASILSELTNFFELDKSIDLTLNEAQHSRSLSVRISNSVYLSIFDKSDEALINDYEEILQQLSSENSELASIFNILIEDFIHKNPETFNREVDSDWDNSSIPDKLVFTSPIPLNSEQLQILSAIRREGCKYITVEGPPGTGKSHTITAIIFDAIIRNQSVLVLSDKKEALDVVEDKITETMNGVRRYDDDKFQNPILRLGKTGSNYGGILAKSSIEKIKTHQRVVQKDLASIEETIPKLEEDLRVGISNEISKYGDIDLDEIHDFYDLENFYKKNQFEFDLVELSEKEDAAIFFDEIRAAMIRTPGILKNDLMFKLLNLDSGSIKDTKSFLSMLNAHISYYALAESVLNKYPSQVNAVLSFGVFSHDQLIKLRQFITDYEAIKLPIFGYLFAGSKVVILNGSFKQAFPLCGYINPHERVNDLKDALMLFEYFIELKKHNESTKNLSVDSPTLLIGLLSESSKLAKYKQDLFSLEQEMTVLLSEIDSYPKSIKKLGISKENILALLNNKLVSMTDLDFERATRYAGLKKSISSKFGAIPEVKYVDKIKEVEKLVTTKVTHLLDTRLLDFYNDNKADAETLREVIRDKKKFPKEQFLKLKEAFPCILAGIRDYAEYIPLEAGLFDLVIIDEASQVSIAQAFPALIRAKKVLILGDRKQFSNVKASQAKSETNREYLNALASVFRVNISEEASKIVKLEKFDIKTSILEFFEFITNYNTQLLKHFRGYKEIISYSNKFFYQGGLQVMKIRGKRIEDVIKFTILEDDGKNELIQNTNRKEIEAIISQLKTLKEADSNLSVGIITPHTNQQKILMEEISRLPDRDYYFDKLNLKIMTFDTCQGEERDIIFYSMVATEQSDRLWGVFIKDLNGIDSEEDGKVKVQRLNVGFSRAKECIHFVLSKSIDKFTGSIGDALRHYSNIVEEAKKEKSVFEVDKNSKMEAEVLNWFYQTDFWQQNTKNIEFIPQFEIGKYLKQLDPTYHHPNYKVDFLLVYKDENHREHKIVIEYDGFREHFRDIDEVNEFNYKNYYSEDDLYRQKVLESYGYKFLRINKFNIGENPILTINERISSLIKNGVSARNNPLLDSIYENIDGLQSGDKKTCPKCGEIRDSIDFKDSSLVRGYGRFCKYCKRTTYRTAERVQPILTDKDCPKCSSKMVLRNGRRGKFYGCSRFPYCKGARNLA